MSRVKKDLSTRKHPKTGCYYFYYHHHHHHHDHHHYFYYHYYLPAALIEIVITEIFFFDRVLIEENIFFLFDLKINLVCLFYGYFATFCKISQIFFNLECIVIKLNAWANIMSVANVDCLLSRPRSLDC